jgi:peptidoglycan/LPS O-acetylase OafA/YrhL
MEVFGSRWLFGAALLLSFVYCVGILAIGCANERVFNSSCIVFLWEFVLGMVAGKAYLERNYAFWQIPLGWLAVGTCSCLAIYGTMSLSMGAFGRTFNDPFALFAFMGCMILTYRISQRRMPMLNDKIAFLSIFSYEIYLIHALVLKLNWGIVQPTTTINGLATSVAGTSLAVVIGYAYWQFVNHISRARWRPVNFQ